jgi:predicted DNA binding CopG/RHH family protein
MKRKIPRLRSDKAAEAFFARDLSSLDLAKFQPVRFKLQPKTERENMRLSKSLLADGPRGRTRNPS